MRIERNKDFSSAADGKERSVTIDKPMLAKSGNEPTVHLTTTRQADNVLLCTLGYDDDVPIAPLICPLTSHLSPV